MSGSPSCRPMKMKRSKNKKSFTFGILIASALAVIALIVTAVNWFLTMPFYEDTGSLNPSQSAAQENIKKVAIIAADLSDPMAYTEAIELHGKFSLNTKISASLFDSRFSAEKQAAYIESCLDEGYNAMVVFPVQLDYIGKSLQKAAGSGVLCVLAGDEDYGEIYNAVYYDNGTAGELIGQNLQASMRTDATAAIVYDKRSLGKTKATDDALAHTLQNLQRVRITGKLYSAEFEPNSLMKKIQELSPDTVILCDESKSLNLAEMLKARGFSGSITVVSTDEKALTMLLSGDISALVYKDIQKLNSQIYNIVIRGIQGKPSGGRISLYPELLNVHNIKDYMEQRYNQYSD